MITLDQGIDLERELCGKNLAVAVLRTRSNRFEDVEPCIPELLRILPALTAGTFRLIG